MSLICRMIMNRLVRSTLGLRRLQAAFSEVAKSSGKAPARREYLQFSKNRLVEFGELPFGEIPSALAYNRPASLERLSNGVRVAAQYWPGSDAAITVTVKAGSRQENLESSSVAQFAAHAALKGTASHSKEQIEDKIDQFGGHLTVKVDRELSMFTLYVDKEQVKQAVEFLSEVVLKPTFDPSQIEAIKPTLYKNTSDMDPARIVEENVHFTSFRDHFMGQPSRGIRENVYAITPEQVSHYHSRYYVGNNIVVSGAGDINIAQFNEAVAQNFGVVKTQSGAIENSDQVSYTPSLMFQRDDEIPNTSIGIGLLAPGWNDPDFVAMQFFKRLMGEYRIDRHGTAHLNSSQLQYNQFHTYLGRYPDIVYYNPVYFAYSDTGLFVNFLYGNPLFNKEMLMLSQNRMTEMAQYVNVAEVFRARNKYWNDLLDLNDPAIVSKRNSRQAAYLDRLISRTELATRVSNMDPSYVTKVATKWFWDKDISITAWGNLHHEMTDSHYFKPYQRSTLGDYSMIDVHYSR